MKQLGLVAAIAVGAFLYHSFTSAERDVDGVIVAGGSIDAFQMQVGDCFDDAVQAGEDAEIANVPGVPCSEPHDNEVFAIFDVALGEFPSEDEMASLAFESCIARFSAFVGRDYETSVLDITAMYPSRDSFNLQNDREVVCAVYNLNFEKLVGSVKGRGI